MQIVEYEDNIEQKTDILLELNKGDVPEIPSFGKTVISGSTYNGYNYGSLVSDLRENFLQNDLFEDISVENIDYKDNDLYITVNIQTKYVYSTTKDLKI